MSNPKTSLTPQEAATVDHNVAHEPYPIRVIEAEDQFDNAILGGSVDESMSAHFGRMRNSKNRFARGVGKFMSWWLDKIQPKHVERAAEGDRYRAELNEQAEENSGEIPKVDK